MPKRLVLVVLISLTSCTKQEPPRKKTPVPDDGRKAAFTVAERRPIEPTPEPEDLHPERFKVGQAGTLDLPVRIEKIIDRDTVLVTLGKFARWRFFVHGFETGGDVVGSHISFPGLLKVAGTAKHKNDTLHVLEPLTESEKGLMADARRTNDARAKSDHERKLAEARRKADKATEARLKAEWEKEEKARIAAAEAENRSAARIGEHIAALAVKGKRFDASAALGKIGEPAVPALIGVFVSAKDDETRIAAAYVLAGIGPAAKEALPELRKVAEKQADDDVGRAAKRAIARIAR